MNHHINRQCLTAALAVAVLSSSCAIDRGPVLSGTYQTWDDVITRWIGQPKMDLVHELGPPQFHHGAPDGQEELVWDMTLTRMPGQAEYYETLPLYGGVDCRLFFSANAQGVITSGRRVGCN